MIQKRTLKKSIFLSILLVFVTIFSTIFPAPSYSQDEATLSTEDETTQDLDYYKKYEKYLKYEKYQDYKDYQDYKEKYGFKNSTERIQYKELYKKYKEYKKNPLKFRQYSVYYEQYKKYKNYKNKYKPTTEYAKYKKYKKYNVSKYKSYGKSKYKQGHERYKEYLANKSVTDLGEADLGGGTLGPEISVGLWYYSKTDLTDNPFKIKANKSYNIKNNDGNIIAQIPPDTSTRVTYTSEGILKVYGSVSETLSNGIVYFDAVDGNNTDLIFDVYKPSSSFDQYRGKISLRYSDSSKNIWVINTLPLEHYVWGMGEITGTGDEEYNRVMTTSFRTYGYWKIKFSTKYATEGFKVNATPGNQIYYGYDWETGHTRIRDAAQSTQGHIVMYSGKIAITPYSSWTDGNTRSFKEVWDSDDYPWCQSVSDPYGKHPTKTTAELQAEGNHMVGLSAHGALTLAGDYDWDWTRILSYYFQNINILKVY